MPADRPGRAPRALLALLLLVVLGAGFVFADDLLRGRAQERVASEVAAALDAGQVSVEIAGWPFLAALVTGRLGQVDISATQVPVEADGRHGILNGVDITARQITGHADPERAQAGTLAAVARLDWEQVSALGGLPLRYSEAGRVGLDLTLDIPGHSATVALTAVPIIGPGGQLGFTDPRASVAGFEVPAQLLQDALAGHIPQLTLPVVGTMQYTGLDVTEAGIEVRMYGKDVPLAGLLAA